jgi:hypothetical protein
MAALELNKTWLFRITHIDNLEYLLQHGMHERSHADADPNYVNIGDSTLIQQRNDYNVGVNPPNGQLGAYVPFYFGKLSPMLLNIKTGYRGITQRPQADIVYVSCSIANIIHSCNEWCFTDGHAKTAITTFYNDVDDLKHVDFTMVSERYWRNTVDDFDRMRRKQAEFLVKHHVPPDCVSNIVVYNDDASARVSNLVASSGKTIKVHTLKDFYY